MAQCLWVLTNKEKKKDISEKKRGFKLRVPIIKVWPNHMTMCISHRCEKQSMYNSIAHLEMFKLLNWFIDFFSLPAVRMPCSSVCSSVFLHTLYYWMNIMYWFFFLNLTAQKTTVNVAVVVGEHHISPCCSPKKQILSSQCTQLKAKEH